MLDDLDLPTIAAYLWAFCQIAVICAFACILVAKSRP